MSANSSRSSSSTCCRNPDRGVDDERMICSNAVVTRASRSQLPDGRRRGGCLALLMPSLLSALVGEAASHFTARYPRQGRRAFYFDKGNNAAGGWMRSNRRNDFVIVLRKFIGTISWLRSRGGLAICGGTELIKALPTFLLARPVRKLRAGFGFLRRRR